MVVGVIVSHDYAQEWQKKNYDNYQIMLPHEHDDDDRRCPHRSVMPIENAIDREPASICLRFKATM